MTATSFPSLLQHFFTDRLRQQRQASPHTMAGYRDTFRLLLRFAAERLGRAPSALTLEDFTPALSATFSTISSASGAIAIGPGMRGSPRSIRSRSTSR